jgi:hypothetical protein
VLIPEAEDRAAVHGIIYRELVTGQVLDASREVYRAVIQRLVERGAQGIILGCTEIMLLIGQADSPVPIFDTTTLHARRRRWTGRWANRAIRRLRRHLLTVTPARTASAPGPRPPRRPGSSA